MPFNWIEYGKVFIICLKVVLSFRFFCFFFLLTMNCFVRITNRMTDSININQLQHNARNLFYKFLLFSYWNVLKFVKNLRFYEADLLFNLPKRYISHLLHKRPILSFVDPMHVLMMIYLWLTTWPRQQQWTSLPDSLIYFIEFPHSDNLGRHSSSHFKNWICAGNDFPEIRSVVGQCFCQLRFFFQILTKRILLLRATKTRSVFITHRASSFWCVNTFPCSVQCLNATRREMSNFTERHHFYVSCSFFKVPVSALIEYSVTISENFNFSPPVARAWENSMQFVNM